MSPKNPGVKKILGPKKDMKLPLGITTQTGTPPIAHLRIRPTKPKEAKGISQAIDRALAELIRQVRGPNEVRHESKN